MTTLIIFKISKLETGEYAVSKRCGSSFEIPESIVKVDSVNFETLAEAKKLAVDLEEKSKAENKDLHPLDVD